jgi:hypothetical protein
MRLLTPIGAGCFAALWLLAAGANAQTTNQAFAARAEKEFSQAKENLANRRNDLAATVQFCRTAYALAELATNSAQRAAAAQAGIDACQRLLSRDAKSVAGHYYLAMNLGELAEAEAPSLHAYRLVKEIEREFKSSADLDVQYDFAGPARCLGLLYRDAPGWPVSIGSKHKAREWLDRAAALAPDYPENQLNLVETHVGWRDAAAAEKAMKKLEAIWPEAKKKLSGAEWDSFWDDWMIRREKVVAEFKRIFNREW